MFSFSRTQLGDFSMHVTETITEVMGWELTFICALTVEGNLILLETIMIKHYWYTLKVLQPNTQIYQVLCHPNAGNAKTN